MCPNRFNPDQIQQLRESLLFFHVKELQDLLATLGLDGKGTKKILVLRILHFLETGEKLKAPKLPKEALAQRGRSYPLEEHTLMVKGAYKNDLKTRKFFQQLIGSHFHFTAFGIDWLNEKWLKGAPPTYCEFAQMWEKEYRRRKKEPAPPKEEWAYINFVQNFVFNDPQASHAAIQQAWEKARKEHRDKVDVLLIGGCSAD